MRALISSEDHDWSELLCRVHKRGCQGVRVGIIEMHSRARAHTSERGKRKRRAFDRPTVSKPPSLERSERRYLLFVDQGLVVDSTFERSENVAIAVRRKIL